MPGILKIVATPLGNLSDISLRAIEEIKRADVIFAEDTRHSLKLIQGLKLELKPHCRLVSCDSHKEAQRIKLVVGDLKANKQVLLLSDAGCPTISDPGSLLVEGVVAEGFKVEVIPGPSAHSAAVMGAGLNTTRFAFLGFLPQKKILRKNLILSSVEAGLALVIYESPLRLTKLLAELFLLLGERRVIVARELTKIHETFHRGMLGALLDPPLVEKGECVVIVEAGLIPLKEQDDSQEITRIIKMERQRGQSTKDIAEIIAERFKMKKKSAYVLVIES